MPRPCGYRQPKGWKKLRLSILERDGWQCTRVEDGKRCLKYATEVDHLTPHSQGGTEDPSNLASLCPTHHAEKTKRETAAARWRYTNRRPIETHPGLR